MNLRFIDWIWHVRGTLALDPGQSCSDAFDRLDPLFREAGTSQERTSDTLTFRKKDQAVQDKLSVFDDGVLRIEPAVGGAVLRYRLTSRMLLFCFLAPLMFIGIAQLTVAVNRFQKPPAEAEAKKKKKVEFPMNSIDKALGAPAPEKPDKKKDEAGRKKKPSPTAAYVFAGIFAALYIIGRLLEDRLVKSLFRKRLLGW